MRGYVALLHYCIKKCVEGGRLYQSYDPLGEFEKTRKLDF
jgi:hypothetical protein